MSLCKIYRVKVDGEDFVRARIQQQRDSLGFTAGAEVMVNYGLSGNRSACDSFMDYGFVL